MAAVNAAAGRRGACTRQQMARQVMGQALALAAHDRMTRHVWWDFLTLLFGPSRRSATRRRNGSLYARRNTPEASRLRRAWRWMRATG
jgi:hypothetical protein